MPKISPFLWFDKEAEEAASWVENQRLTMIDRPLKDILPELLRWYNVDATVRDLSLLEHKATIRTSLDSGDVALAEGHLVPQRR